MPGTLTDLEIIDNVKEKKLIVENYEEKKVKQACYELRASNIYYDTQEGSEPYVTKENMPEVEGIVIVAKGGGDGNVCADITAAAEALLGVPAHKIKGLKMN